MLFLNNRIVLVASTNHLCVCVCIYLWILRFDAPTSVDCNFIEVEAEEAEKGEKKTTGKRQLKIMFLVLLAPQPILVSSSMLLFCVFFFILLGVYLCRHSFPFHTILFSLNFNFSYLFLTTYSAYLPIFSNVYIWFDAGAGGGAATAVAETADAKWIRSAHVRTI